MYICNLAKCHGEDVGCREILYWEILGESDLLCMARESFTKEVIIELWSEVLVSS